MKVIKKGREQKGWAQQFTCTGKGNRGGGCGAILLVEEDDMYFTSSSCYDGSTDYFNTFKCCDCGVETDVSDSKVSARVKDKMQEKRDARTKGQSRTNGEKSCVDRA